jgi:hypothetical protein
VIKRIVDQEGSLSSFLDKALKREPAPSPEEFRRQRV